MKLFRNGVLVAEGKATGDLDSDVLLFRVKKWHVRDPDTNPWLVAKAATWTIDDGTRTTDYASTEVRIGCFRDEVRSLAIDATDPLGRVVHIDVR